MRIVDSCLEELKPFLQEPLVSPADVEKVSTRAASVPEAMQAFYLECRLSPPGPQVDFLGSVARRRSEDEAVGATEKRDDPAGQFLQRWRIGAGALRSPAVWTELDDNPHVGPLSNIHVCVDSAYRGPKAGMPPFDRTGASLLLRELAEASVVSAQQLAVLDDCLGGLPDSARLIHVSAMTARSPVETKVYVAIPVEKFRPWVTLGPGSAWAAQLERLEPWTTPELNGSTLYCDLTFRGATYQSIGLVFGQPQIPETGDDQGRERVRRKLVQEGLCTLAQDAALAKWVGAPLNPVCSFDTSLRLRRWLDIKVSMTKARLSSKAYLGFSPHVSLF
ncbi:MAG: hypothetical protein ABUL60_00960 [Myxococcales bacterium]